MTPKNDPLWYKDAIIYQLHVKAFYDTTNDGIGDFRGLTEKLDYMAELGVTAVWVLPFYPSPLRDDGYDISDYMNINPAFGTMRDFRVFVREAHRRGLRVITELVINHTSDQHPWFQRARRSRPTSRYRDYYVWSDSDQKYQGTRIIFCDTEVSNWAWDPVAQAYYWHRFFSHQPDLNFDNPRVMDEIIRIMKFWLEAGVDGLRLDAVPYLCEREGTNNENLRETHAVIKRLRAWVDANYGDRMFLAEANQWPEDVRPYFGAGDECHMAFHFPLMPRMYMALAREDRYPITDIMRQTPDIPDNCQWAIFLRNHDELTLEMVTDRERDYLWQFYAAEPRARINLGIRRRLATLLDGDRRKIELLNSLLMSMPGTPIIYYGDEIGMGDNIFLGDRNGVRTPMQWSPDRNAGFSKTDPERLFLPPVMDPIYGYESINVESQLRQPSSLLNWMRRLIAARKAHPAFGRGSLTFLYPRNRKILAYLRSYDNETLLCVANISQAPQAAELDLADFKGQVPVEMLGRSAFPPIGDLPYFITLVGYGFYWFLLAEEADAPKWYNPYVTPLPEFRTFVLARGWASVVEGDNAIGLWTKVLPDFLPNQRWFAAKGTRIVSVHLADSGEMVAGRDSFLLSCLDVELASGVKQRYFLPLAIAWETATDDPLSQLQAYTIARARVGGRIGAMHDAMASPPFSQRVVRGILKNEEIETVYRGRMIFKRTHALEEMGVPEELEVERLGREQSNTSVMINDTMIFKAFRRLQTGIHPEIEIGRFLTDVAGYKNTPPLLGSIEMVGADGTPTALGVLQSLIRNQGDGWDFTLDYLERVLGQLEFLPAGLEVEFEELHAVYLALAETLGRRVAELHRAFAMEVDDPAFRPEPVSADDLAGWDEQVREQAAAAEEAMQRALAAGKLNEDGRYMVQSLLGRWEQIGRAIDVFLPGAVEELKTRLHGDLHLGQVIVVRDDFFILDFEGEPLKTMEQRRNKQSPLRDVAGMIRSFDYAAHTALLQRSVRPEKEEELRSTVRDWEERVIERFIGSYRTAVAGCRSIPPDDATFNALVNLFTLEKALYEIVYEATNRPDWLSIPVQGVQRVLAAAG